MKMFIGIKYREKGETEQNFVIIHADSQKEAVEKFWAAVEKEAIPVDKRTVTWAGAADPLNYGDVLWLGNTNIDDVG